MLNTKLGRILEVIYLGFVMAEKDINLDAEEEEKFIQDLTEMEKTVRDRLLRKSNLMLPLID